MSQIHDSAQNLIGD